MRALGLCILLAVSGCGKPPCAILEASRCSGKPAGRPVGYVYPKLRGISIVSNSDAAAYKLAGVWWSEALGSAPMDEWIVDYLRAARQHGATMVWGIEAHARTLRDGQLFDCKVRFDVWHVSDWTYEPNATGYQQTSRPRTTWHFRRSKPSCARTDQAHNHVAATIYGPGLVPTDQSRRRR